MSEPSVAVDEWTAWAVRMMVSVDDQEVMRWIEVLERAYDALRDEADPQWEVLAERVQAADGVDPTALEEFVRMVGDTGRGVELVAGILAERDRFPGLYWELVAAAEEASAETTSDPLAWVSAEQRDRLARIWGDGWAEHLPPHLEHQWGPDWQSHPDEHKAAWLDPLIAELTTAEPTEPEPLPDEQLTAVLTDAMAGVPGSAQLSEEDIAEIMAQVRARTEGTQR